MKLGELINDLNKCPVPVLIPDLVTVKTVDEDGFVRDVTGVSYDPETGVFVLRLEIQKKNGELV